MEHKNIIIILVVIIVILAVAVGLMFVEISKIKTNLAIADKTVGVGDSLVVVLADDNGNPISGETINIKLTYENGSAINEKLTTNSKGKANFTMEEMGNYSVECKFDGNSKYASSSISDNVKVEQATTKLVGQEQTSSNSGSSLPYSLYNLPPSNDPYPETSREQTGEYTVMQKYEDGYISYVDLRTGERSSGGYYK